jgi:hypothetical protein
MGDAELNKKQPNGQICFNCRFCGKQIRVPSVHAGKQGKCPQCKNIILVPQEKAPPAPVPDLELQLQPNLPRSSTIADQQYEMLRQSAGLASLSPPPLKRKYPWLIDIFLYPVNCHGMIFLAIVVLIPLMFQLVVEFLAERVMILAIFVAMINFIVVIVLLMFVFWFLAECIRDSAAGNLRAPNTASDAPGLAEMGLRLIRMFFCFVVYLLPAALYYKYTHSDDLTFRIIAGCGIFLYPMALLGVLMFDSIHGLSPLITIPSLFSAFFQYCGLIILVCTILFLFVKARGFFASNPLLWLSVRAIEIYMLMIVAHLLGRFYFKYQEKLNWDV